MLSETQLQRGLTVHGEDANRQGSFKLPAILLRVLSGCLMGKG